MSKAKKISNQQKKCQTISTPHHFTHNFSHNFTARSTNYFITISYLCTNITTNLKPYILCTER